MTFLNRCSLGSQLILVFICVFSVVLSALAVYDYSRHLTEIKTAKLNNLLAISKSVSASIGEDIYNDNYVAIEQKLLALNGINVISSIRLHDKNGNVISELLRNDSQEFSLTHRYGESDTELKREFVGYLADDSLMVRAPILFSGQVFAWLELQSSAKEMQKSSTDVITELIFFYVLMLIISSLTIIVFLRIKLRPLDELTKFSSQLPHAHGRTIELKNAPREFASLVDSLSWASKEIHNQHNELLTQNLTLEHRVVLRTKEFEEAKDLAEQASHAKSEFLSRMSHELRTPLNAILGFAQLLDMDAEQFDEMQRDNVYEILSAGEHLLTLINDVLDLAKIESGKMDVSMEEVDVADVLEECLALIKLQANEHQICLKNNVKDNSYKIYADATRFKQILLNLLSNAVKYNREHGSVSINAEVVEDDRIRISVIDTGEGLMQEEIEQLFTSFERLNEVNNVEGAGIGLVISKYLVELMDGRIGVESKLGEGSLFWFELELFVKSQ